MLHFRLVEDKTKLEHPEIIIEHWKTKLDKAKSLIDDIFSDDWSQKSGWYEMVKHLTRTLKHHKFDIKKRLGLSHSDKPKVFNLTETNYSGAFCKCIELLNFVGKKTFEKYRDKDEKDLMIRHFDNASLPGDFIRAGTVWTNAYDIPYDWRASSLVNEDGKVEALTDRYGVLRNNPTKWLMSDTMNGDVLDPNNRQKMKELLPWQPNLYTSDIGFRFSSYTNEEAEHYDFNKSQLELGLNVLSKGGIMITKHFLLFNQNSRDILTRLYTLFDEVHVVKPVTSKPDNSELYTVCIGYNYPGSSIDLPTDIEAPKLLFVHMIEAFTNSQISKIKSNVTRYSKYKFKNNRNEFNVQITNWIKKNLVCHK